MLGSQTKTRNYINNRVRDVQNYQLPPLFAQFGVEYLNILVFGPKKSGKSSVINSIKSVMERKYVHVSSKQDNASQNAFSTFPINNAKTVKLWLSQAYTGETIER